ncbi:MAG: SGNH/GDSL hydrolase family protein [Bacteroidetes bacterium]|nr:SGNH/GDSL hydrolase family protein [Bacteroidota bacterium]MDA1122005.1 SGNH/GDSL hydrolase family protein [Bacteroidota bacterium]
MQNRLSYLALGDSYTIGEAVDEAERWPIQLVNELSKVGFDTIEQRIIACTGWTTDDLLSAICQALPNKSYDLVSINIGVNNQYRGYPINQYEKELRKILELAISFTIKENKGVIVISIPDYGVTPFGQQHAPKQITEEIDRYNRITEDICDNNKIAFVNITDISRKAKDNPTLIASDGLHPSGKMYSQWVEKILPKIRLLIG